MSQKPKLENTKNTLKIRFQKMSIYYFKQDHS